MIASAKVAAQTSEGVILACSLRKATYSSLLALTQMTETGLSDRCEHTKKRRFWHDLKVVPLQISFSVSPVTVPSVSLLTSIYMA